MCRHGDTVEVVLNGRKLDIDRCLVPYVKALNTNGIQTSMCCCGHGEIDGTIRTIFNDEYRLIIICPPGMESLERFKNEFQASQEKFQRLKA